MPLSGRLRSDGHAPRAPYRHTVLSNFHVTFDVDSSRSGPPRFSHRWRQDVLWRHLWSWETNSRCRVGSPMIPGKSFDCQQQLDVPRTDLWNHLDCSGRLHFIWRPNGVVTRANSTAEDSQKDAFLSSALSADAAHVFLSSHPPNLLFPWSHWSAKLARHAQLTRRLPVEPWPKPIDRGLRMRLPAMPSCHESPGFASQDPSLCCASKYEFSP